MLDLKKQWDSKVTELEDDLELRVDEIAKSVLDGSKELQVLARAVKNLERWGDEVAYRNAGLEECTASPGRDTNTGCSGCLRFRSSTEWWTFQLHADFGTAQCNTV